MRGNDFMRARFSVPMSDGKTTQCAEKGHSGADSKGRCYCCGEKIVETTSVGRSTMSMHRFQFDGLAKP